MVTLDGEDISVIPLTSVPFALNASRTNYSAHAVEAEHAVLADTAHFVMTTPMSDTSGFALESQHSEHADTSNFTHQADHAMHADTANFSHQTNHSLSSDSSDYAGVAGIIQGVTVSVTELNYVAGATSAIQTQLDLSLIHI